jgi:hypothetical protein
MCPYDFGVWIHVLACQLIATNLSSKDYSINRVFSYIDNGGESKHLTTNS